MEFVRILFPLSVESNFLVISVSVIIELINKLQFTRLPEDQRMVSGKIELHNIANL